MNIDRVSERKCTESILNRNIETAQFFSIYTTSPFRLRKKCVEYDNTKSTQVHSDRENIDIKINMPIYIRKEVSTNVSDAFLQNNMLNHEIENGYTYESLDKTKLNHTDRSTECLRSWKNYSSISAIDRTIHINNNGNQYIRNPYSQEILNNKDINNLKIEEKESERYNFNYSSHTSDNKIEHAEKTTCSRPIINLYNEDFISKTLQRNERLKCLLQKIIIHRQKSKENSERNNYYVNMHNKYSREYETETINRDIQQGEVFCKPEAIHEYNYRHLQDDFYRRHQTMQYYNDRYKPLVDGYICKNNTRCFPTSSRGKMSRVITDGDNYCKNCLRYENLCKNKTSRKTSEINKHALFNSGSCSKSSLEIKTNRCLQTDMVLLPLFKDKLPVTVKSKSQTHSVKTDVISEKTRQYKRDTSKEAKIKVHNTDAPDKVRRLRMKIYGPNHTEEQNTLKGIERKLEELRTTINNLILEKKNIKSETEGTTVLKCDYNDKLKPSEVTSDTLRVRNTEKLVCGFDVISSKSTPVSSDFYHTACNKNDNNNLNVVPAEEMISIEKYINDLFIRRQIRLPYTIKINFDIPTKDHSTEVTASLSKAKCKFGEVNTTDNRNKEKAEDVGIATSNYAEKRMTIAVNTDPLGILSLLRVSADTLRRLLSFMPNFNYSRHSSKLKLPQLNGEMSYSYICNICGAAFLRPLQLTDHIQCHHLKFPRDCCVCRHEMDIQRNRPLDRYTCQYCKQGFTRAYCCELHQQSCAKRFGKKRDVSTSLLLLR